MINLMLNGKVMIFHLIAGLKKIHWKNTGGKSK